MNKPTEMPEWLKRQFDNVEHIVEAWSEAKKEACGLLPSRAERDRQSLSDIVFPAWRLDPTRPIDDDTLIRLTLQWIKELATRTTATPAHDKASEGEVQKSLTETVEMCWAYFDQCCQDQRNMVPNAEAMRDICRQTLDEAKEQP